MNWVRLDGDEYSHLPVGRGSGKTGCYKQLRGYHVYPKGYVPGASERCPTCWNSRPDKYLSH